LKPTRGFKVAIVKKRQKVTKKTNQKASVQVKTKVTTSNPKSENIERKKKFHMKHYDNIEIKVKVMTSVAWIYQKFLI
jgi:hypothetical protein